MNTKIDQYENDEIVNLRDLIVVFGYTKELWNLLFVYDDGRLIRRVRTGPSTNIGGRAGTDRKDGYRQIKVNNKWFMEHRVIYEMHFGEIPAKMEIDHIDRNPSNNSILNLRAVTTFTNNGNTGMLTNNTSGFKGVHFSKVARKWQAQIGDGKRRIHLGYFESAEAAYQEYKMAYFAKHGVDYHE